MKKYDQFCLTSSILSLVPIAFLILAFFPNTFLYDNDSVVLTFAALSFGLVMAAFYFAIPYYDDKTSEKRPFTRQFAWGIGVGFVGLFSTIFFTPLVFLVWSAGGIQTLIALVS